MTTILDRVLRAVDQSNLGAEQTVRPRECIIIAHIHVLHSTTALFNHLVKRLHFKEDMIFVIPKPYSTIERTRERLQKIGLQVADDRHFRFMLGYYDDAAERLIRRHCREAFVKALAEKAHRIILVDDGGQLSQIWEADFAPDLPIPVVSVQQTASGAWRPSDEFPHLRIDVARSAAKRLFESHIIVDGVLNRVRKMNVWAPMDRVGVVGVGAVGSRLAAALVEAGKKVFTYDIDEHIDVDGAERVPNVQSLLAFSRFVFGCSGRAAIDTKTRINQVIHMASCSSRDIEFRRILRHRHPRGPRRGHFGRVHVNLPGGPSYVIENGGFPVNFDRHNEWESNDQIALTRGLVLLGILQATTLPTTRNTRRFDILDSQAQQKLVEIWLEANAKTPEDFGIDNRQFRDLDWWDFNSRAKAPAMAQTSSHGRKLIAPELSPLRDEQDVGSAEDERDGGAGGRFPLFRQAS